MNKCILCDKKDCSFDSEEHIIPESLGNKTYILRKGVVCDNCNNKLSKLDEYFVHNNFNSIERLWIENLKTKKGKFPKQILTKNNTIEKIDEKNVILSTHEQILDKDLSIPKKKSSDYSLKIIYAPNGMNIDFEMKRDSINTKMISRFLSKVAVEYLYYKSETDFLNSKFNELKKYLYSEHQNKYVPFLYKKSSDDILSIKIYNLIQSSNTEIKFNFVEIKLLKSIYYFPLIKIYDLSGLNLLKNKLGGQLIETDRMIKLDPLLFKF